MAPCSGASSEVWSFLSDSPPARLTWSWSFGEAPSVPDGSGGKSKESRETPNAVRGRGEAPASIVAAQGPPSFASPYYSAFSPPASWYLLLPGLPPWPSLAQLFQPFAPPSREALDKPFRGIRLICPCGRVPTCPSCACEGCRGRSRTYRPRVCLAPGYY